MFEENMSKIDEIFKTAMDSHSEPYNPQAWESLSKRLDGGIPPRKNPFLKWGLPSIALVIGVASVWYFTSGKPTKTGPSGKNNEGVTNLVQNETKQQVAESDGRANLPGAHQELAATATKNSPNVVQQNATLHESIPQEIISDNTIKDSEIKISENDEVQLVPITSDKLENNPISNRDPKPVDEYIALLFPTCENSLQEIKNENNFTVSIQSENRTLQINAKETVKIKFEEGNYDVVKVGDGTVLQTHKINASMPCEIVIGDLYYQDGLPYRHTSIKTEAQITDIQSKGVHVKCCIKEQDIMVFHKGNYTLNIGVSHETGCSTTKEESFYVSDDYNLLAVNAFEPLSLDARKSTFIPFALTQRNTPFRMIIIDPNDGGIVFETSDAQQPWDGIDKRTGKMADTNKAYVWKVNLTKPEPGEKMDYMGTVVRM
jgi:hypothetical protein